MIDAASAIAQVWQLRDLSPEATDALTAAGGVEPQLDGAAIIRQGETGEDAFVLIDGRLEVRIDGRHGPVPIAVLGPGELFGEQAILDPANVRTARVVA